MHCVVAITGFLFVVSNKAAIVKNVPLIRRLMQSKFVWSVAIFILISTGYLLFVRSMSKQSPFTQPTVNAGTLAVIASTNTPSLSVRATAISRQTLGSVLLETVPQATPSEISAVLSTTGKTTSTRTPVPVTPTLQTRVLLTATTTSASTTPDLTSFSTVVQPNSPVATPKVVSKPTGLSASLVDLLARLVPPLQLGSIPPQLAPPTPSAGTEISLPLIIDSSRRPVAEAQNEGASSTNGKARTATVPILMYHYLSIPPADADIYRLDLSVTPDQFAAHLDILLAEGFQTISLYDLYNHLTQGVPLPPKPVVITFDDGYRDNYQNAFPLLVDRGMIATFFIVTDFIDQGRPEYITWEMAREMYSAGMSLESHGRTHDSFKGKGYEFLVWQALGSSETIEFQLGSRPHFVSYPAGDYDAFTIEVFHDANYWAAVTTVQGAVQSTERLFEMPRIRVRGTTSADDLIRLLSLDW